MFGFFKKNPIEKLEKEYAHKMKEALNAQRSGNISLYSELSQQAEKIINHIDELKKNLDS